MVARVEDLLNLTGDQQRLLEERDRLDELHRSYDEDARLNEPFVVLTLGASLIATLGLLADNAAVVIGAMVVAPWILPLRVAVFAILVGDWRLLPRSALTLAASAIVTVLLSMSLGLIAQANGLLIVDSFTGVDDFTGEIQSRLTPTLLDLGIALAAGAIATYAKVNPGAVSSMAGTAIAVALVPPVCVMGLMLAAGDFTDARGAGLLYAANLLGILIGGISVLAIREPYFRDKLRRQRRSRLPLLLALALASWVGFKLYGRYEQHLYAVKRDNAKVRIEQDISAYLKQRTQTFGSNDSLELENILFDWPDYWSSNQTPKILLVVRVTNPATPSYKQVQYIQDRINEKLSEQFDGLKMQMEVQRINVSVVSGSEVMDSINIKTILDQAESPEETLQPNPSPPDSHQAEGSGVREDPEDSDLSTTP